MINGFMMIPGDNVAWTRTLDQVTVNVGRMKGHQIRVGDRFETQAQDVYVVVGIIEIRNTLWSQTLLMYQVDEGAATVRGLLEREEFVGTTEPIDLFCDLFLDNRSVWL